MSEEKETLEKRQILSGIMGYTLLPVAGTDGERTRRLIPSFGVSYGFRFTHWFALALNGEVEVDAYILFEGAEEELEREYPVLLTLNAIFEPVKGLGVKVGSGMEFETNRNLFIFQLGLEYGFELTNNWVIGPEVIFITKDWKASGGSFGLAFGKVF